MAPQYKVTYFDVQALGEPIRFMLSYGNLEFEDYRFSDEEWPAIQPSTPFGKVPLLDFDGKRLNQHATICRYLAKKFNIAGKDDFEAAQIDALVDTFQDFRTPLHNYFYEEDPKIKAPQLAPIQKEIVPFYLGKFEEIVKANGGYFVNKKLTWADIYFIAISGYLQKMSEVDFFTSRYPNLKALKEKIENLPGIKRWLQIRPAVNPNVQD